VSKSRNKVIILFALIALVTALAVVLGVYLISGIRGSNIEKFSDFRSYINDLPRKGPDISGLNLTTQKDAAEVLKFSQFNLNTKWPSKEKMPASFDPVKLLNSAKNPGLGIAALHAKGITGKGISIGVIDLPIFTKNTEYKDRIKEYKAFGESGLKSSDTSVALLSALVGRTVGMAPDADVYYAATATDKLDVAYYSQAVDWFIELNKSLPKEKRIRLVMVPVAPDAIGEGDYSTPFTANTNLWGPALKRAEAAGIVIFDLTSRRKTGACWIDTSKPDDFLAVQQGYPDEPNKDVMSGDVLVPTSPKTVVEEYVEGQTGYRYIPRTGAPFITSYTVGLVALGIQSAGFEKTKALTLQMFNDKLYSTSYAQKNGLKINHIVNPKAFIEALKKN